MIQAETESKIIKLLEEILIEVKKRQQLPIPAEGHEFNYYEHCSCNPKNGGSGICHCTLGGMKITC